MEKKYFNQDAKTIVDMFFDTGIFREDITRDDMNRTQTFIEDVMVSRFERNLTIEKFMREINVNK